MQHLGSSITIALGIIVMSVGAGNLRIAETGFSEQSMTILNGGITLLVGGLAYRSSKVRRLNLQAEGFIRGFLEFSAMALILFLLFGAGAAFFKKQLAEDPFWPITSFVVIAAWVISCFMPRGQISSQSSRIPHNDFSRESTKFPDKFFEAAAMDFDGPTRNVGMYTRHLIHHAGDEKLARLSYITERMEQISKSANPMRALR